MSKKKAGYFLITHIIYFLAILIYFLFNKEGFSIMTMLLLISGSILLLINQYLVFKKRKKEQ